MKIINNILKIIVYLSNTFFILMYMVLLVYLFTYFEKGDTKGIIELSISAILYIYLTYLFCINTTLNKKNDFKVNIIATSILILKGVSYILQCQSLYSIFTIPFFLWGYLPNIFLLISIKFNTLYNKKTTLFD